MSIQFHFCELFANPPLNQKVNLNKKFVEKVINGYPEKGKSILRKQNILYFFNDKLRLNAPNPLGQMFMRNSFDYIHFKKEFHYEIKKISNFSNFKFIIYISREIAESDDEIFKSLTIAHELQHVLQEIDFYCMINKDTVLRKYFRLKSLFEFSDYLNHPKEIDAFTEAKKITNSLFGEKEVVDFLEKQISKLDSLLNKTKDTYSQKKWGREKQYWQYIKNLDRKEPYDLKSEFEKLWISYKAKIEHELLSAKNKSDENTKDFVLAYNIYSSKCS